MQALPDLDLDAPETQRPDPVKHAGQSGLGRTLALVLLVGLMVFGVCGGTAWWVHREHQAHTALVREEQQAVAQDITRLKTAQAEDSERIDSYDERLGHIHDQLARQRGENVEAQQALSKLEQRVDGLVQRFDDIEARRQALSEELARARKSTHAPPKPVSRRVVPAELVAIASYGGISHVTIKVGHEVSDQLRPGDRFGDWRLLDADPARRIARFEVAGETWELRP